MVYIRLILGPDLLLLFPYSRFHSLRDCTPVALVSAESNTLVSTARLLASEPPCWVAYPAQSIAPAQRSLALSRLDRSVAKASDETDSMSPDTTRSVPLLACASTAAFLAKKCSAWCARGGIAGAAGASAAAELAAFVAFLRFGAILLAFGLRQKRRHSESVTQTQLSHVVKSQLAFQSHAATCRALFQPAV